MKIEAIDSYIYSGHLFVILKDGDIAYKPLDQVIEKLVNSFPHYSDLLKIAFQRNDYISNSQADMLLGISEIKKAFQEVWTNAVENFNFILKFSKADFTIISNVPTMPILDMKMYALRLYLGSKAGLYEIKLNSDNINKIKPSKPQKVFDSKVTCLNAKSGEIIISASDDGLFHGTFLNDKNTLQVSEKSAANKSLRTGWAGYDIINYEAQNALHYFVNKTEKTLKKKGFSKFDETYEQQTITDFGISQFSAESLLANSKIDLQEIKYCFNSSSSGFFLMNDGAFLNANLNKQKKERVYFSSRVSALPNIAKEETKFSKPISTSIVPRGCVIEYFDKVVLYKNERAQIIENGAAISLRSYPSSLRYRHLISITKLDEIAIHSIFPFDEKVDSLTIYPSFDAQFE